jgi:transposase InsO family protein
MTDRLLREHEGQLPLTRLAELCGAVRTSYYRRQARSAQAKSARQRDYQPLVHRLHQICARETGYGYRRVTRALHNDGQKINHKRVLRLMRQEKLLWRAHRRFKPPTTDSRHDLMVYPNLLESTEITQINQVWVSDITYVSCGSDHTCYLAVVLDAESRNCLGWSLQRYLDARLTREALQGAMAKRAAPRIHHSDRGMQYASEEYTRLLKAENVRISMSRRANPYDNARAESFFKTLKNEEVEIQDYASLDQARRSIGAYIARYNQRRMHSSLGYLSPEQYEAAHHKNKIATLRSRKLVSA